MRKAAILLLFLFTLQSHGSAQDKNNPFTPDEDKKPTSPDEFKTRSEIERAEERQRKLVAAAEELNKLAHEIAKSARNQSLLSSLSGEDQKKLGRIEKLAKMVRSNQGGADDEDLDDPPGNLKAALDRLEQAAFGVQKEMGKVTRHGISISLIERTNEVLALTKFIKKMGEK
jgi:hypothetical protein